MPQTTRSAAVSHTGKIRSNNQDSGYAGRRLFLVADGMGGHAGGDVASAIAAQRIKQIDRDYATAEEAQFSLQAAMIAANSLLAETVFEHPELTGMGTTVSAFIRVGDKLAFGHIGDSRIYLLRDGELTQISKDHTFVQRLVDTGRITEEEALVHPRRSVLMRVLGDVDSSPEIDTWVADARPGDRLLICSDGLSGVVKHEAIAQTLSVDDPPKLVAERLVKQSLDAGAPDNVTVVIVDIDPDETPDETDGDAEPVTVGSAAGPLAFENDEPAKARAALRLPTLRLHPMRPAIAQSHFEPQTQDYLDELIEEDERRARRRKLTWLAAIVLLLIAIVGGCILGYQWTQSRYFVGVSHGRVAIYQGVQQDLGPLSMSHVYESSTTRATDLTQYEQEQLEQTINADSLADARRIVENLTHDQQHR